LDADDSDVIYFDEKDMFDEVQKRLFLHLSEDTNEKDIFGGNLLACIFNSL